MAKIHVAGFMSTNVDPRSINECFLNQCSAQLARCFGTQDEFVTLELQYNQHMLRAGSSKAMLNLRLFHNCDLVDADSKHQYAKHLAEWLARTIRVPEDRVLVLFVDTRFTSVGTGFEQQRF